MMKAVFLAGAAMIASPLLAQEAPKADTTDMSAPATEPQATTPEAAPPMAQPDATTTTAPTTATPPTGTDTPVQTTETAPAPATPAEPATQTAETQPTAQPAASHVAAVIDADFGKYDADKNGNLSKEEFGAWMTALKKASDPTTVAGSTELNTWVGQAFAQADVDKSAAVSKPELTKFLAPQAG